MGKRHLRVRLGKIQNVDLLVELLCQMHQYEMRHVIHDLFWRGILSLKDLNMYGNVEMESDKLIVVQQNSRLLI